MYPQSTPRRADGAQPAVLLVGIGALGCPAAAILARAGLGRLTIVDPDRVERSNLQRQLLFDDADLGEPKAEVAARRLGASGADIVPVFGRLDRANAVELVAAHDVTIDACDDPSIKFLINEVAVHVGRPYSYGGVARTAGATMTIVPGSSACLACVFPDPTIGDAQAEAIAPGCHEAGVLGPIPGVIGSLQAFLAMGLLGRAPMPIGGRLFAYELRGPHWRILDAARDDRCAICAAAPTPTENRRTDPCRSSAD